MQGASPLPREQLRGGAGRSGRRRPRVHGAQPRGGEPGGGAATSDLACEGKAAGAGLGREARDRDRDRQRQREREIEE